MSLQSIILHKRNNLAGLVPSSASLSAGEIAINTADGKLFTKTETNSVKTFLNEEQTPFLLNEQLSSVNYQHGANNVTGVFSAVLGGISNSNTGAGSTIVNGSNNSISADYSLIGGGFNHNITSLGDYGAILGGQNNTLQHQESFILGSNITSHLSATTYVNNLSATGKVYGDGSELRGIVQGDTQATTLVRSSSASWNLAHEISTAYQSVSSSFLTSETDSQTLAFNESTNELSISNGNVVSLSSLIDDSGIDSEVRALTANWQDTYTNQINFLPLSGGTITGTLSVNNGLEINPISGTSVLYVEPLKVGINTEIPNVELTIVGDVSATGKIYGDGSELQGIVQGDAQVTTLVRSNSAAWDSVYTNFNSNSATYVKTTETSTSGLSAVSFIVAVTALPAVQDPGTLYLVV